MELWCETAAAVVNNGRKKMTPAEAAAHVIHYAELVKQIPELGPASDSSVPPVTAGAYDQHVRLYRNGRYVR